MFNKKMMLVIGGAVAASVAAFAVIAGTVVAQRGDSDRGGRTVDQEVASVPAISKMLVGDMDSEQFDRSPGRDSDIGSKLSQLVEAGDLSQDDADALTTWYDAKPEVTILTDTRIPKFAVYVMATEPTYIEMMVSEGVISQADGDALTAWLNTKPDVDFPEFNAKRFGHGFDGGKRGFGADFADEDFDVTEELSMLVDKGILTQADADALTEWFNSKPEINFPDTVDYDDWYGHAEGDEDSGEGTDLASELSEAVEAGYLTQADADAILAWLEAMPEVSVVFGSGAKSWLFDGEGRDGDFGISRMFDMLAESGFVTEDQATEIKTWIDEMPDFSFNVGKIAKRMIDGEFETDADTGFNVSSMLSQAVSKGVITQSDADALSSWWDDKPAIVGTLMNAMEDGIERSGRGAHGRGFGRGGHGARFSPAGASY